MNETVERVARAMAFSWNCDPDSLIGTEMPEFISHPRLGAYGPHLKMKDEKYVPAWQYFVPLARAAIAAMLEPTEAMLSEANGLSDQNGYVSPLESWQAMIGAALKDA